jgi:GTP-binding protein EngB required for normal cell division
MLTLLREHQKNIVIVANKIDKIKRGEYDARIASITDLAHGAPVVPYSSKTGKGTEELVNALLGR